MAFPPKSKTLIAFLIIITRKKKVFKTNTFDCLEILYQFVNGINKIIEEKETLISYMYMYNNFFSMHI